MHVGETDYEKEKTLVSMECYFSGRTNKERVVSQYPEIGEIQEFSVKKRSDGGAVRELELVGTKGKKSLCNEYAIREFFSPEIFNFEGMGQRAEA